MIFNIGDTVQLKSGGPDMTIQEIDDRDQIVVSWPDDEGVIQCAEFPAASLWRISPAGDGSSKHLRAQLTVTHYLALICFCDLLFRSSFTSLSKYVLGMVVGTVLVWCAEKLWKKYAT